MRKMYNKIININFANSARIAKLCERGGVLFETIYNRRGNVLQMLPGRIYPSETVRAEWWVKSQNSSNQVILRLP